METSMLALSCWWFRWLSWRFTWVFFSAQPMVVKSGCFDYNTFPHLSRW
jgi:hypothetical protein